MESMFDPMTFNSNTMLNYQLSQKLKLIEKSKFNYLIITLTLYSSTQEIQTLDNKKSSS
jgi:hypothetical protein